MSDTEKLKLNDEQRKYIRNAAMSVAGTVAMKGLMAAATQMITILSVTNKRSADPVGVKEITPTKDETVLDKKETAGSKNEAALAKDDVRGQQGAVEASDTEAQASKTDARAADGGASAMTSKAGAMDVATKAMKIN